MSAKNSVDDTKPKGYQLAGSLFVGCAIIGTAIGMMVDQTAIGAMLGVGVGFIVAAISKTFIK